MLQMSEGIKHHILYRSGEDPCQEHGWMYMHKILLQMARCYYLSWKHSFQDY